MLKQSVYSHVKYLNLCTHISARCPFSHATNIHSTCFWCCHQQLVCHSHCTCVAFTSNIRNYAQQTHRWHWQIDKWISICNNLFSLGTHSNQFIPGNVPDDRCCKLKYFENDDCIVINLNIYLYRVHWVICTRIQWHTRILTTLKHFRRETIPLMWDMEICWTIYLDRNHRQLDRF